ncbi:MAG: hypothetical protein Q8R98_05190, partial [Rubrivivax sp.]|nr:hypothetical protein [Rubrivivax sp.]
MHKRRPVVISLLLPLLLAACASAPVAPPPGPPLVWPAAPDAPRVQFVRTIVRAEDLDIRKGLMQRLSEVLFGANDQRLVRPMAVADAGGVLYVADPGVRGVHRFDRQAGHYEIVRRADG